MKCEDKGENLHRKFWIFAKAATREDLAEMFGGIKNAVLASQLVACYP